MKTKMKLVLLTLCLTFLSCKTDLCDKGYTDVNGVCIPDYVVGITNKSIIEEQLYFHFEFGIIHNTKGLWYNENNKIVDVFQNKKR